MELQNDQSYFHVKSEWLKNPQISKLHEHIVVISVIFRQIDLQYNSLVEKLVWRNFCKKIVGEKFTNFHTVTNWNTSQTSVEITEITHFWQKFRESNGLTKLVT